MSQTKRQLRTIPLSKVLEGAARAEERVAAWPEWKRNLSFSTGTPNATRQDSSTRQTQRTD